MTKQTEIERPLPNDLQSEQCVLGAILNDHKDRNSLIDGLEVEDYFDSRNQQIFRVMRELISDSKPVDLLTIYEELQRLGKLESAGGIAYISQLGDGSVPRALDVGYRVHSLKQLGRRRSIIHASHDLTEAAFSGIGATEELLDRGIERLSDLARSAEADQDETVGYRDAASTLLTTLGGNEKGIRVYTGLRSLDETTGGAREGELWVFTGGTGHGKTLFVQRMRRNACKDGHHVLFCSGEMLAPHLVSRELAAEAGVKPVKVRLSEQLTKDDWERLTKTASQECNVCRILDSELSLARIRRVARGMKARTGIGLIVIDYDELVNAPGGDELEQQRNLARGAKSLAMELRIPVVMVSQLRKPLDPKASSLPTLQDLYGSGAKSKHASCIVFVDRPYVRELKGDETEARIAVLKHRDGRVGKVEATFNIETLRFETPNSQT
jgi:replicative DNA helicase